jgi:tRNA (cmo5U34)-methyltransferase
VPVKKRRENDPAAKPSWTAPKTKKRRNMKTDNSTPHLSSNYDEQVRKTIPYYDCFHIETINLIKSTGIAPKIWLDTGCGTGSLIEKALDVFKDTIFVMVDPSPEMLNVAKNKLSNNERVKFLDPVVTQDIDLRFKADVITAIQAHHYLTKQGREKATRVCFDLLEDKGLYITFENIRPFSPEGIKLGKDYWTKFQVINGKDVDAVNKHMERFDREYFPITVEEHLKALRACGFKTAELFWYSYMQAGFYGIK